MLLAEFIAGAVMLSAGALGMLESRPARVMLYAIARWRRQRRALRKRALAD